jgi:CHASE2 domain-containing sensor protein
VLAVRKAGDFWSVTPQPRSTRSTLGWWKDAVCAAWTAPLFAFALFGAVLAWRRGGAMRALAVEISLTALLFTLPHALAWGGTRLRVPFDPLLVGVASVGVTAAWARFRGSA